MQIYRCLLIILLLVLTVSLQEQKSQQVPVSFAFITVTHTRGNNYINIQKHINRYATMDCTIASEMNIVWNNEIQPDIAPIYNKRTQWKRPVYFYKTSNNSMDWRYKIPQQSKAQVFFIIDDDVQIDCTQLQRGFKKWQENAIGNIAPIVTYAVRFFEYTQQTGFSYGRKKQRDMFAIGLVGLSFMSRHFMDLYYSNIEIIEEMRKIVQQKNNCDDIGINWLIQYFYPELQTIYIQAARGNLLANSPIIAQSTTPTHYPYRSQCILQFTKIFGVNVLRYKPIHDNYSKKQLRIVPLRNQTILAKKRFLQNLINGNTSVGNGFKNDKQNKTRQAKRQQKSLPKQKQVKDKQMPLSDNRIQTSPPQYLSLEQVLLLCVLILVVMVVFLIYLLLKMINEKKLILMKHNQMDAIQSSREAVNQE